MSSEDNKQGASPPPEENSGNTNEQTAAEETPSTGSAPGSGEQASEPASEAEDTAPEEPTPEETTPKETTAEEQSAADEHAGDDLYDPYEDYDDDPYGYDGEGSTEQQPAAETKEVAKTEDKTAEKASADPPPPPSPPSSDGGDDDGDDGDDDGMLRMSFMDHLEELRSRIIKALMGVGVAFFVAIIFANDLWLIVSEPATDALTKLGVDPPHLAQIKPMEVFTTVWVKLPILTAIFLASPWVLYQVWAFIAPGLYKRERRWSIPFVLCSAGLFITGGLFAYFVAFRFGLSFLLGIGQNINIVPVVSITDYFDLFVNVTLGIALVFELPILVFFLTLLRIVTPGFLVRNSRYAVLIIVVIAAIITPTPDVVNLMLFAVPMCLLYFVGVFAGYLLNLHRDKERFPWGTLFLIVLAFLLVAAGCIYLAIAQFGFMVQWTWPYITR